MVVQRRICILTLCTFFVLNGFSTRINGETETKSAGELNGSSKDDIFIDDVQADAAEGSATANDFSEQDERWSSSGMGPDDEDAFEGSGEGSGVGIVFKEPTGVPSSPSDTKTRITMTSKKQSNAKTHDDLVPLTEAPIRQPSPKATPIELHTTPTTTRLTTTTITTPMWTTTTTTTVLPPNSPVHPDENKVQEIPMKTPDKIVPPPPQPYPPNVEDKGDTDERSSSLINQPGIVAAVIGGAVVGLLCAILLVMFIVYRMRKKDEGKHPTTAPSHGYEQGKPYDWKSQGSGWPLREKC